MNTEANDVKHIRHVKWLKQVPMSEYPFNSMVRNTLQLTVPCAV